MTQTLPLFGENEVSFGLKGLVHHWQYTSHQGVRVSTVCQGPTKRRRDWELESSRHHETTVRLGEGTVSKCGELSTVRGRGGEHCGIARLSSRQDLW